ncbi:MAG: oxygen-dependent coproporphyrinogen oxidase [Thermoanaerobaculia bacterium]
MSAAGRDEDLRRRAARHLSELQDVITRALEELDGGRFREDLWERPGGGGGRTRVLSEGALFEKAGVSFSEVHGELGEEVSRQLPGEGRSFHATGISLVLHPRSPMVPAVHANFRAIRRGERGWFGGGSDLTPYYLFEEDARHFHRVWKRVCDRHDPAYYPRFKGWCDEYFFLPHRGETRGVGGIFFDYLEEDPERTFAFWKEAGEAFLDAYLPIARGRRAEPYSDAEREFQLLRRGRYVEFNLLYDRGTAFGLKTAGRSESILISLPPLARWSYGAEPAPGTREAALLEVLRRPREWC